MALQARRPQGSAHSSDERPRMSFEALSEPQRRQNPGRQDSGVTTELSSRASPLTCSELQNELRHFAKHTLQPQLLEIATKLQKELVEELKSPASGPGPPGPPTESACDSKEELIVQQPIATRGDSGVRCARSRASLTRMSRGQLLAMGLQEESICSESDLQAGFKKKSSLPKAKLVKVMPTESPCSVATMLHSATTNTGELEAMTITTRWRQRAQSVVRSVWFEKMASLAITLNAIYVAIATEYMSTHELESAPLAFTVIETIFLVVFSTEMALRFLVQRLGLFRSRLPDGNPNDSLYWNILDFVVITLQVVEIILTAAQYQFTAFSGLSVVRILRLVRLVRIIRVVKVMRSVRDLRMILYSIWRSVSLFLWAMLALMLLNFMCSVYFTEYALVEKLRGEREYLDELDMYFGSFLKTMLSLFMAITGGMDWGDLSMVLSAGELSFVIIPFALYVAFATIAMLNVVSGIILETAMEIARDEKEVWVIRNARVVFDRLDRNQDGTITMQDFMKSLDHPHMIRFFQSMRIEMSEAQALFDLLDMSGDGIVSANEFLNGCIRVRGPAKALDLLILSREVSQLFEAHSHMKGSLARKGTFRRRQSVTSGGEEEVVEAYDSSPRDLVGMLRLNTKHSAAKFAASGDFAPCGSAGTAEPNISFAECRSDQTNITVADSGGGELECPGQVSGPDCPPRSRLERPLELRGDPPAGDVVKVLS